MILTGTVEPCGIGNCGANDCCCKICPAKRPKRFEPIFCDVSSELNWNKISFDVIANNTSLILTYESLVRYNQIDKKRQTRRIERSTN